MVFIKGRKARKSSAARKNGVHKGRKARKSSAVRKSGVQSKNVHKLIIKYTQKATNYLK